MKYYPVQLLLLYYVSIVMTVRQDSTSLKMGSAMVPKYQKKIKNIGNSENQNNINQ